MNNQPKYAIAIIEQGKTLDTGLVALLPFNHNEEAANKAYEEIEVTPSYYKTLSVTKFKKYDKSFIGPEEDGEYIPSVLKSSQFRAKFIFSTN